MHAMLPKHGTISAALGCGRRQLVFVVAVLIMPNQKLVCCVASVLRGAEVHIVCTIADGLRCSAHVLTYAEGHISMKLHADQAELLASCG